MGNAADHWKLEIGSVRRVNVERRERKIFCGGATQKSGQSEFKCQRIAWTAAKNTLSREHIDALQ
jgi:hypothetical protein